MGLALIDRKGKTSEKGPLCAYALRPPGEPADKEERMTGRLDETVAIVTGGSRGIGRAVARALVNAGAGVSIAARSDHELAETAALLRQVSDRVAAIPADVTDAGAVHRLVEETERQLGPVDVLVNNAGTCYALGPVWEVDADAWWRDIEVSLRGSFLCARAVLPGMLARRRGRIINMGSGIGLRPSAFSSAYSCAKAALLRLTDSIAAATRGHGVSVFAVSPGNVQTAMMDYLTDSEAGRRSAWWAGTGVPAAGARGGPLRPARLGPRRSSLGALHPRDPRSRRHDGALGRDRAGRPVCAPTPHASPALLTSR